MSAAQLEKGGDVLLEAVAAAACTAVQAVTARNKIIVVAHQAGVSLRDIAAVAQVSHTEVARIVKRQGT